MSAGDLPACLALYDNKGYVLARVAARLSGLAKSSDLQDKLTRSLGEKDSRIKDALVAALPVIAT